MPDPEDEAIEEGDDFLPRWPTAAELQVADEDGATDRAGDYLTEFTEPW